MVRMEEGKSTFKISRGNHTDYQVNGTNYEVSHCEGNCKVNSNFNHVSDIFG